MDWLKHPQRPYLAAHRGVSGGNIPCNSEAAFRAAMAQGADIIELDVTKARDGTLFVFHPGMEHAHLTSPLPLRLLKKSGVLRRRYGNQDRAETVYGVMLLDDALELLRGRCIVNIDKFWTAPEAITACIRRHGMADDVLIKTSSAPHDLSAVEAVAPDLPFVVMARSPKDAQAAARRRLNFVGVEALFKTGDAPVASEAFIAAQHERGRFLWGNAIVYNRRDVISAGHTDDAAVTGDPDSGWGWFRDRGFDVVQTDWLLAAKTYFEGTK